MKSLLILSVLFFSGARLLFFESACAQEDRAHRLAGKFQKADSRYQKIAPEGLFFMIVNEKGEKLAFPVSFKNKAARDSALANLSKNYLIEGERDQLQVFNENEEMQQSVHVLKISSMREVGLSELRPKISQASDTNSKGLPMKRPESKSQGVVSSPGVGGLNDTATNAAIFTAGAILLGSILAK